MVLSAEFTFKESTSSYGYFPCPVLSMLKLISEFLDKWGDTPNPSDPRIIIIFLYLVS